MKFCHTQTNGFKLDFGSVPFQENFPQELQLIKQMIVKYPQCQHCWLLLRTTKAKFQSSISMHAGLFSDPVPSPLQACSIITMCARVRRKFREQGAQNLKKKKNTQAHKNYFTIHIDIQKWKLLFLIINNSCHSVQLKNSILQI